MNEIDARIAAAKKELDRLIAERDKPEPHADEAWLAEKIHGRECRWNHTDGCGWEYESDWTGYAHKRYLVQAQAVLARMPVELSRSNTMLVLKAVYGD